MSVDDNERKRDYSNNESIMSWTRWLTCLKTTTDELVSKDLVLDKLLYNREEAGYKIKRSILSVFQTDLVYDQ